MGNPPPMKNFVKCSPSISFKYKNGVICGTDVSFTYGNLTRYSLPDQRIYKLSSEILLIFCGELSDIQHFIDILKYEDEVNKTSGDDLTLVGYKTLIQRILYNARSKLKPYNLSLTLCDNSDIYGLTELGNFFEEKIVTFGVGAYLVVSYLEGLKLEQLNKDEAIGAMKDALRLLHYRHTKSSPFVQIAYIEEGKIDIEEVVKLESNWDLGEIEYNYL